MDYRDFVRKHRESGAAITIAALPCAEKEASVGGVGVLQGLWGLPCRQLRSGAHVAVEHVRVWGQQGRMTALSGCRRA